MRPVYLELEGFTAFRAPAVIDFSNLDLFALVGPTGSGKSSILDAITFALYNQTERLGSRSLQSLISQGAHMLKVSFHFEVGEKVYRVVRTRGLKSGDSEVRLEVKSGKIWENITSSHIKVTNQTIIDIVGLDYESFTKGILLPQGKFDVFLKGTATERIKLLGDLCGSAIVEQMAKHVSEKERDLKRDIEYKISALDEEYSQITEEYAGQIRKAREENAQKIADLHKDYDKLSKKLTELTEKSQIFLTMRKIKSKVKMLQDQGEKMKDLESEVLLGRKAMDVLPIIHESDKLNIIIQSEDIEIKASELDIEKNQKKLDETEKNLFEARESEKQLESLGEKVEYLRRAEILENRLRITKTSIEHVHERPIAWNEEAYEDARTEALRYEKWLEQTKRFESLEVKQKEDREMLAEYINNREKVKVEGVRVRKAWEDAKLEHRKVKAEHEVRLGVQAYREHLHEGKPCPLCRQTVEQISESDDSGELSQELQVLANKAQELGDLCNELRVEYRSFGSKIEDLEKSLKSNEKVMQQLTWQGDIPQATAVDQVSRLLAGLAKQVRDAGKNPVKQREQVQLQIQKIRKNMSETQETYSRLHADIRTKRAVLEEKMNKTEQDRQRHLKLRQEVVNMLKELNIEEHEVRRLQVSKKELDSLEEKVQDHKSQLMQAQLQLDEIKGKHGDIPFDFEELSLVESNVVSSKKEIEERQKEAGKLEQREIELDERLKVKKKVQEKVKVLQKEQVNWKTLSDNLKGNNFRTYMMAEIESQILTTANQLLNNISDRRYQLYLQGKEYMVRDAWNADEVRAVKTLSGGEIFLASLALSVALSDYLTNNKVLGALFLDEGFGSLDPQALDAVARALEHLRSQNRMVGVVTHVESLSEKLPVRLFVTKSASGSQIRRVE